MALEITSSTFENNQLIPSKYTCDGDNVNPPLTFRNIPKDAQSLVLLVDDPDVPKNLKPDGVFDHWVIYNIDPSVTGIDENSSAPPGSVGLNSAQKHAYAGACPPDGQHRYFFKLFALDTMVEFPDAKVVTKQMVLDAMDGHIVEQAELVGLYKRQTAA